MTLRLRPYTSNNLANILEDDIWMYVTRPLAHLGGGITAHIGSHTTAIGAAYGTAKSGIGIAGVGTFRPDLIMKACRLFMGY